MKVYTDLSTGKLYLKPNEEISKTGVLSGNYKVTFNFLRNIFNERDENNNLIFGWAGTEQSPYLIPILL